jgi:hypothetical protein
MSFFAVCCSGKLNCMLRAQALLILATMVLATVYARYLPVFFAPTPEHEPNPLIEECGQYLPPRVSLDKRFARFEFGGKDTVTVRERLFELGAYPKDGAIYSWDGTPIYLHEPVHPRIRLGAPPECDPKDKARVASLRHKGIVILLYPEPERSQCVRGLSY